jgi:hypothetical protein
MHGKEIGSFGKDSLTRTGKGSVPRIKEMATESEVGESMGVHLKMRIQRMLTKKL